MGHFLAAAKSSRFGDARAKGAAIDGEMVIK
jgi:hypothetical protein